MSENNGLFLGILEGLELGIIIILLTFLVGKLANILLKKLFLEIQLDANLSKAISKNVKISKFLANGISLAIYISGTLWALTEAGLLHLLLRGLGLIFLLALAGSIFLSLTDFLPNFIAGMWIRKNNLLREGRKVKLNIVEGKVEKRKLLAISLRTDEGELVIIPNRLLQKEIIIKKK